MKKNIKEKRYKFIKQTSLLVILMLLTSIIISLFKNTSYGGIRTESLGTNVTGTFDSSTGELVIESTNGEGVITKTIRNAFGEDDAQNNIKKVTFTNPVSITCHSFFSSMKKLETIENIAHLNTSNLTSMGWMFYGCSSLPSIDLSSFDTSNVTIMTSMFAYCSSLTSLDLSNFDTSNVTSMSSIFYGCHFLKNLDISSFNTSNVTDMFSMFTGCSALTSLDLSHFDTSNVTNMMQMFYLCGPLKSIDLSSFDTSNVTSMYAMFRECNSLTNLDLKNFETSKVKDMEYMFNGCRELTNLDLSSFNTSNVTNMHRMFRECSSLTNLDVSKFDTSKVTNMREMFFGCSSLTSLNLSNFETSNISDMSLMFFRCSSLVSLNLSSFDTSNVTSMNQMFFECRSLTSLNLSNFETSNVSDMDCMFFVCESLTSLDVSKFETSNVSNMRQMFYQCKSLTSLDLSSFNTSNVTNVNSMFGEMSNLNDLYTPHTYSTEKVQLPGTYGNKTNAQDTNKYTSFKQGDFTGSVHLVKDFSNIPQSTYKIEHYLEQEDGSYKKDETLTEILTGKIGEKVTAKSKTIKGYTEDKTNTDKVVNGEIAEDGSLVLKIYYKKVIIKETEAIYKIEYYLQQEDGSYKKDETLTENLTGKIGEKVTAKGKTIEGYTEDTTNTNRVVNGEIAEDGSLVLKVYYKKEIIKETIKNEPIIQDTTTAKPESMPYAGISKTIITISILVIIIGIYYYTRYIKLRKYVK